MMALELYTAKHKNEKQWPGHKIIVNQLALRKFQVLLPQLR